MSGRRFSTEEYAGARVAFPVAFADRLVDVARGELAAQLRFVDDDEDPARVIQQWLDGKQTVPMPAPHAEPGDLLVKVGRAETWTFTVHGWRELAPIELVGDPEQREPWPPRPTEYQDPLLAGERMAEARRQRREHETDFTATAPRFFGKSVVEEELDRLHAEKNAPAAAADPVPRNVRDALDELHQHADVLEDVAQALGDHPDGGNNSPHYEAIAQARTFARAIEYSRGIIWKHATRRQGSS